MQSQRSHVVARRRPRDLWQAFELTVHILSISGGVASNPSGSKKLLMNHMATYYSVVQIECHGRDKSCIFDLAAQSMVFSDSTVSKPSVNSLGLQRNTNGEWQKCQRLQSKQGEELEILEKVQAVQQPRREKVQALSDLTAETRQLPAGTALRLDIRCRCSRPSSCCCCVKELSCLGVSA